MHTYNKITYDRIGNTNINIINNTTQVSKMYLRKQTNFTEKKLFQYLTTDELNLSLMNSMRNLAKSKNQNNS